MKAQIIKAFSKSTFIGLLLATIAFSCSSCAKKIPFLNSSVVPAARGTVKIDRDKNHNYVIKLDITNLAEVSRLTPPKTAYVVWMDASKNMTKNIGQIESSTKTFSDKLEATFVSTSSAKPTKIYITAEDNANAQYPSSQIVLATKEF